MGSLSWLAPEWDRGMVSSVVQVAQQLDRTTFLGTTVLGEHTCLIQAVEEIDLCPGTRLTLLGFHSRRSEDLYILSAGEASDLLVHAPPSSRLVTDFRELCSGMAALGTGAVHAGFRVVGVNELQCRTAVVASHVSGVTVVLGDVAADASVAQLWKAYPWEAGVAAGFSCQPFSALGDQKGRHDTRNQSLVGVLRAAFLLQAPWLVLECVAPAGSNEFVLACLREFCQTLQYQWTSVELELSHVWSANRKRWWCVVTKVGMPEVLLRAWQPSAHFLTVGDVLQVPEQGGKAVEQLLLTQHELSEFSQRKSLDAFVLRSNMAMPTALHAWGAQVLPCPCGCRPFPFRASRLDDKLCAVLLRVEGGDEVRYRHLTPKEAALLCGLDPAVLPGDDARLELTLVGQLASPLRSCWVFGLLRQCCDPHCSLDFPERLLEWQKRKLLLSAAKCGLRCPTVPAAVLPHEMDSCPGGSPCGLPLSLLGTGDDVGSGHVGRPAAGFTVNPEAAPTCVSGGFLAVPRVGLPPTAAALSVGAGESPGAGEPVTHKLNHGVGPVFAGMPIVGPPGPACDPSHSQALVPGCAVDFTRAAPRVGFSLTAAEPPLGAGECSGSHAVDDVQSTQPARPFFTPLPPSAL